MKDFSIKIKEHKRRKKASKKVDDVLEVPGVSVKATTQKKRLIGKRINLFIFFLLMLAILVVAGYSVFFQDSLVESTLERKTAERDLKQCGLQLDNANYELSIIRENLNSTEQDIRKYDTLYAEKLAQITDLDSRLSTLQSDIIRLQEERDRYLSERNTLQVEATNYKNLYEDADAELTQCTDDLEEALDELALLQP